MTETFPPSAAGWRSPATVSYAPCARTGSRSTSCTSPRDLNLLWAHLRRDGAGWTHVVAFGGELPILVGPVLAAWLGLPLVTLLRGNDFDAAVFNPRRRPALEAAVRASARVVCVTRDMAARAAALWPGVAVEAIANGIDVAGFAATPADRARAQTWRVPGRVHLGLIGQFKAKKGALLLEALALGVPVLASDAGGMPELVRDGENGVLFAAGDLEDCRAALEHALDTRPEFPAGRVPSHTAEAAAYRALLATAGQAIEGASGNAASAASRSDSENSGSSSSPARNAS